MYQNILIFVYTDEYTREKDRLHVKFVERSLEFKEILKGIL